MKHTPGPWRAEAAGNPQTDPQWHVLADDQWIAQTLHGNDEANARLIAAAPYLHAALVRLRHSGLIDLTDDQTMEVDRALAIVEGS